MNVVNDSYLAHSNEHINIEIDGMAMKRINKTKSLSLQINEHFTWAQHVGNMTKKIASAIGALKRIRQFIDTSTALKIFRAFVQPYFDYCSSVWNGLNITLLDRKLQKLRNRAARVDTEYGNDTSSSDFFSKLGWDSLSTPRKKHKAVLNN